MPTTSLPGVPIRDLVAFATRAPSVHNTQPWHWCVSGEQIALFADSRRQLQYADPDGRDLVISCGAALHHLQVAAAASGWRPRVRRMPNRYNEAQLANVSFHPEPVTPAALAALDMLTNRRTDRRRPSSWHVPRERLDGLLALGPAAGVTIVAVVSHRARTELLQILAEAEKAQRLNRRYVDEIVHWTGREDGEGIPAASLLRRGPAAGPATSPATAPSRFPSGTLTDHERESEPVEPALVAICTSSDDTASRLRAGEALSAMLLKGTAEGLAMVPLSQAIEVDRTRHLIQNELLGDAACPQIIVQVGWALPAGDQVPLTTRRPVDDVLGDVASLAPWIGPYHA
jgi:nitroreductase